jgi:hypothetical protein
MTFDSFADDELDAIGDRFSFAREESPIPHRKRTQIREAAVRVSKALSLRSMSEGDAHSRAIFLAWRYARWALQASGWAQPGEAFIFSCDILSKTPNNPCFGLPMGPWGVELPRRPSATLNLSTPGLPTTHRIMHRFDSGFFVSPPEADAPATHREAFCHLVHTAVECLRFHTPTKEGLKAGIYRISPFHLIPDHPYYSQEAYEHILENFPTYEEVLEFEQDFLTECAEAIIRRTEDGLRKWLIRRYGMTTYEATSITATAKAWGASMRPVNLEVERSTHLRLLDHAGQQAADNGDYRALIIATTQAGRILGLAQHSPGDENQEALAAASEAHQDLLSAPEGEDGLIDEPIDREAWRSKAINTAAHQRRSDT